MRRALKLLFPWIVLCAVFWKPLLGSGMGIGAKAFFRVSRGWTLDYRAVAWQEKGLVFSDLILKEPSHFQLKADEAVLSFSKKHLEVERPRIVLRELPSLKTPNFSWTFAVRNGTLKGHGIEKAKFEAERKVLAQGIRFELKWEESSFAGELLDEQGTWKCDLLLQEFNPQVLRKWLGEEIAGTFNGRAYLVWDGQKWARGMGRITGKNVAWKEHAEGIFGSIDWEGPFAWEQFLQKGRARVRFDEGKVFDWSGLAGEGNFVGGMGTKWEFVGIGETFPVHWQGRGFFQSLKEHWVDSKLSCGDALFSLQGRKKEEWTWEGKCEQVEAKALGFVQTFLTLLDPNVSEFALLDGTFDLQWKAAGPIHQLGHWELISFSGKELKGKGKNWTLAVEKGNYAPNGEFSFEKGSFDPSSVWSGHGKIEEGKVGAQFEGKWEEFLLYAKAQGSKEEFSVDVRGDGPLMGEGTFAGGWDGKKIHFTVERGEIGGLHFAGNGWVDFGWNFIFQIDSFYGPISTLWKLRGEESLFDGMIEGIGNGFTVQKGEKGWDWALQAQIEEGRGPLSSYARVEGVDFELGADPNGFQCINMKGNFISGQEIAFHCPIIQSQGEFDVRLLGETWDFLRLAGTSTKTGLIFDLKKSHLLGASFQSATCSFEDAKFQINLPWRSCLAACCYFSFPRHWITLPLQGELGITFCYGKKEGSQLKVHGENLLWKQEPLPFDLYAFETGKKWILDHLQVGDFSFAAEILPLEKMLQIDKGRGTCNESLEFTVEGKIAGNQMELKVPSMKIDLGLVSTIAEQLEIPFQKIEGVLEGTGHIHWKEKFESDFDFAASQLRVGSMIAENQGPLHVYYSSDRGALFRGLDLQIHNPDLDLPAFGWKIDLLQYGNNSFWKVERSHLHVPKECLETLMTTFPFLEALQPTHDIDLIADLDCNSDFLDGSFREGFLPVGGILRRVQNAHFLWNENRCSGDFSYFHQGHLLKVGFQIDTDAFKGRLTLQDGEKPPEGIPLTLDWSRENGAFLLHSIEGSFAGVEALFHAEAPHFLIGSARIDFTELSEWIPPRIAEVFHDLKMGKGYEIKGRLNLAEMAFRGLLSGKQLELFGYQLRTMLGQFELTPERVHISDLKVSDSAGILKIEELIAETKGVEPWTISMPRLTITELRPCLLQKVGEEGLGPPTPLVVRELKLNDFRGFLEDSRTYTASGELFFINSYRRDHTVFDLPSDVLSRIVGLDLEILIPVCGTVTYELKDRLFRLIDLRDSYSAGERTKFFLVKEGSSPTMDLDGNLQILVKMKQFVIFKFTESFLISIDGKLDEPKFHLQKKRRFLGL